jgi:MFS family permease
MGRARFSALGEAFYVLAFLGAHIAFMPFLVLLLPRRIAAIAPAGEGDHLLSILVLVGGITASLANIAAGHFSDKAMARTGNRRRTMAGGLACLAACYAVLSVTYNPIVLTIGVIAFQISVNLLFAPIGALLADYTPDHRKGRMAGFLSCGLPAANGAVGLIAWVTPVDGAGGFALTAALIIVCVMPLLVAWPFAATSRAQTHGKPKPVPMIEPALPIGNIVRAWGARFLLQLGATLLTNYLYPYITFLLRRPMASTGWTADAVVGWLSLSAGLAACCCAVAMGSLSDRLAERRKLLIVSALSTALALTGLAVAPNWSIVTAAYVLFHLSLAAFFAVESAFSAEMIALSSTRGRLLGYMNLANTLPAILTAILALQTSRQTLLGAAMPLVLLGCASACVIAAALCAAMRVRQGDRAPITAHR